MTTKKSAPGELLVQNPDAVLREEGSDGALLFNPDTNQVRVINSTGLFIWKRCNGKRDVRAIVLALKNAYDEVPEADVEAQVEQFIYDMRAGGFLGLADRKKS